MIPVKHFLRSNMLKRKKFLFNKLFTDTAYDLMIKLFKVPPLHHVSDIVFFNIIYIHKVVDVF